MHLFSVEQGSDMSAEEFDWRGADYSGQDGG